jgi:hypothetical protein
MVSFIPLLLYSQGKSPWYPLDRRLGGPQSQSLVPKIFKFPNRLKHISGQIKYSSLLFLSMMMRCYFMSINVPCSELVE